MASSGGENSRGEVNFNMTEKIKQRNGGYLSELMVSSLARICFRHPLEAEDEGQLSHNTMQRLSQFEGSSKCSLQTQPSFTSFWRMHGSSLVDVVNKVSPKDSPSKTTKTGSFERCRPWTETQQLSPCVYQPTPVWHGWVNVLFFFALLGLKIRETFKKKDTKHTHGRNWSLKRAVLRTRKHTHSWVCRADRSWGLSRDKQIKIQ